MNKNNFRFVVFPPRIPDSLSVIVAIKHCSFFFKVQLVRDREKEKCCFFFFTFGIGGKIE